MFASLERSAATILVVDDIPANIHLMREAVKDLGEVFFATNGKHALDLVRSKRPEIILLDIEMPEMDGYEVCKAVKADPEIADTAIIFVTSHDQNLHELQALQYGGVDFIQKPLNIPVTRARVQTQLALHQKNRQLNQARQDLAVLVESLPAFVAYWDHSYRNVFCNDLQGHWFGITAHEMLGLSLDKIVGDELHHQMKSHLTQMEQGKSTLFELTFKDRTNNSVYGQVSLVQRIDEDGEKGFLMLITDISERKLAELALIDEKERIRITLNSIGDAVIATDTNGIVTFVNPIAEDLTGWMSSEAIGHPIEEVMPLKDGTNLHELTNPIRLALQEGRIVGMSLDCKLHCRNGREFEVEDSAAPIRNHKDEITGAIVVFHDVSEARAMAVKMTHLAQHDALTNLPNRILLRDRTEQALKKAERNNQRVALILLDLDHFKDINDTCGHSIGDKLLQDVARELTRTLRAGDTVCRQGGDEFVILLPDVSSTEQLADFSKRLLRVFSRRWDIDQHTFELSVSLGISIYPDDSRDMDELYRHADAAMYSAKQQGRNRYQFYSDDIENRLRVRQALENHLRNALEKNVFEVHFQPKIDIRDHQIVGAEALVRWRKPDGHLVPPVEFIPLAEETGLIIPLGKLVLLQACKQVKIWQQMGFQIPVAVNISVVQFDDPGFIETINEVIAEVGIEASSIELEITESVLAKDINRASHLISELKSLGFRIALDDFGTGYSSLSYIKRFPLNVLKIDQSFVRTMLDDDVDIAIIKAIVQMAIGLKLELVAEGVETWQHAEKLFSLGCHTMQGYYYSKPVTHEAMTALLQQGKLQPVDAQS